MLSRKHSIEIYCDSLFFIQIRHGIRHTHIQHSVVVNKNKIRLSDQTFGKNADQ